MGRKKDRDIKAGARRVAEQARKDTQKIVDRIIKDKTKKMRGAV